ncbi:MAG: SPOR domain-containing protein [Gammaproteobacteria bacterium]|nr:SPOR domain-containing protein [Gammaproteobacteria bacterium]
MTSALAASYELVGIEAVYSEPPENLSLQPRAIVIASSRQRFRGLPENTLSILQPYFVYQTKVKVKEAVFYRLVLGNYKSAIEAQADLNKLKPIFVDSWIYQRSKEELQALSAVIDDPSSIQPSKAEKIRTSKKKPKPEVSMLSTAKQAFLDENYTRVISIANKIISTGDQEQVREALELAGTARERQGRFAQAVTLYETLLSTSPEPETEARIKNRLEGIHTMNITPKARLQEPEKKPDDGLWVFRGALQQYYQDDVIDRSGDGTEKVNQVLVSDVDLQIQRKTNFDKLTIEVDAGLISDFIEDQTDNRVSSAIISYARDSFQVIGGRQYRTVKGVHGRFDGVTYRDLSRSNYQLSYFLGNLVHSSYDELDSDNPLLGANLDFSPYDWLDVNLYVITQEISGLTDRQALGSEFQMQNDVGFIYGIIDYDVFYGDLNNITINSNYRYDEQWSFNLTVGRVNSPTLSTANALQGQLAESIDELGDTFSKDEIYDLAEDRTSKSESLYFGANYSIDSNRQIYVDFSIFSLDAIEASGGVVEIPSMRDMTLSVDYSIRGYFFADDYTSMGLRITDSDSSEIQSIRLRSRFPGYWGLIYDPRVQMDFRENTSNGIDQTILKPSIKLTYRASKKLNLEADFGIEYSDLDLPDFDKQIAYSMYLGYTYFF